MKIFGSKALRFLLVCLAVCGASSTAFASHLRGTSVSWTRTSNPGEVQFTLQYSIRAALVRAAFPAALWGARRRSLFRLVTVAP